MHTQNKIERRPITDWQVEHLRFTAFTLKPTPITDINWWSDLTKETPTSKTQRPRDGTIIEEGSFGNGKLIIQTNPIRIDIILAPDEGREIQPTSLLLIGALPKCLDSFTPLVFDWLNFSSCPELQRIALGAVLRLPVSDKESGYEQLIPYLPSVIIDTKNSFDLQYQINRPIFSTSGVNELRINRLNKWAVARLGMMNVLFSEQPQIHLDTTTDSFSCRLELDVNTHPDWNKQMPRDAIPKLFNEILELAKQIVINGDS